MSAYIVVEIMIHDAKLYEEYKSRVMPTIEQYGGQLLAAGGKTELLEGDWNPPRFVIIEFPSADAARTWWSSPEYAGPKALRQRSAVSHMILVEGVG
ncbi:MAG: DUF1330 domain-containing protein [Arenicellales bacterium]|jgi:uncharacterized protein (DUF1330 family)